MRLETVKCTRSDLKARKKDVCGQEEGTIYWGEGQGGNEICRCNPGRVAQLVGVLSRDTKVVGSVPVRAHIRINQQMHA